MQILDSQSRAGKKPGFLKKKCLGFLGFNVQRLSDEDQTQNYDPEIHEEYLIHDTPFLLPQHLQPYADYSIAINTTN